MSLKEEVDVPLVPEGSRGQDGASSHSLHGAPLTAPSSSLLSVNDAHGRHPHRQRREATSTSSKAIHPCLHESSPRGLFQGQLGFNMVPSFG